MSYSLVLESLVPECPVDGRCMKQIYRELIGSCRELEYFEMGRLVLGRRGSQTRFEVSQLISRDDVIQTLLRHDTIVPTNHNNLDIVKNHLVENDYPHAS